MISFLPESSYFGPPNMMSQEKLRDGGRLDPVQWAVIVSLIWSATFNAAGADDGIDFFESKIRPVLIQHCYECHSREFSEAKGGLVLDSREGIRRGGDSGAAVVPSDPSESLILQAVRYESLEMPPDSKLPGNVIADIEKWIAMGAPDPREEITTPITERKRAEIDWNAARRFWAFQPPNKHEVAVGTSHKIDGFIQSQLAEQGLTPNPLAENRTLLRRLYFDLIGLPPTPSEAEEFLQAAAVDRESALFDLVDSLLASPHFGERWASLWLDVARYAEDQAHIVGSNKELFYPNAYRYRDWLIDAFNEDVPYDELIRLQLAADLHTPEDPRDDVALGFLGLGPKYYRRGALEVMADEWEDRVDVVSRGLLGLTVACARCHDHKFDPIPTEDYYALAGVFASSEMWNRPMEDEAETEKNGQAKEPDQAIHIVRDQKVQDLNVFIRGDVNTKGEVVPRRFLTILSKSTPVAFVHGSGRLELAHLIASSDNPLTARVIVNRIWATYFGQPLVGTPSNFGQLGDVPTHPELLDDLAVRFMENGWSLKWLHREIVTSQTYQRSSDLTPDGKTIDPANRLLARMNRRRLNVEQWRDALLKVTGQLDSAIGGQSMVPDQPDERRRTVYSERSRFQLNPLLAMFDFPDPNAHAAKRVETTTPLQKLFVINSPFMVARAKDFAQRFGTESDDLVVQIQQAYQILFTRPPSQEELEVGRQFLQESTWEQYAQVLLASNEFLFLD
ncbi:MAG: PSD1 domain-containing protein [Planctomycetaceae bacterium]|nr:PSD1 domain-containing protein [Planctomycetaceae bacterium]